MKQQLVQITLRALLLLALAAGTCAASAANVALPGRPVKVAAISIGCGGDHDEKLKLALEHLETAGQQHVDIACLPEEFAGTKIAEPIPGPTVNAVSALAKKHGMYVICPIREQADSEEYNTAVLLDRQGKVAGQYRKVFPFWGEDLLPCFPSRHSTLFRASSRQLVRSTRQHQHKGAN